MTDVDTAAETLARLQEAIKAAASRVQGLPLPREVNVTADYTAVANSGIYGAPHALRSVTRKSVHRFGCWPLHSVDNYVIVAFFPEQCKIGVINEYVDALRLVDANVLVESCSEADLNEIIAQLDQLGTDPTPNGASAEA